MKLRSESMEPSSRNRLHASEEGSVDRARAPPARNSRLTNSPSASARTAQAGPPASHGACQRREIHLPLSLVPAQYREGPGGIVDGPLQQGLREVPKEEVDGCSEAGRNAPPGGGDSASSGVVWIHGGGFGLFVCIVIVIIMEATNQTPNSSLT
jgi:hypothetical protein